MAVAANQEIMAQPTAPYCYCGSSKRDEIMLHCENCRRFFHMQCLKTGKPSVFEGDMFFTLICADCSGTGEEDCSRMKLQWLPVVMLALYNLQLTKTGNRGYFRWKEQICSYIDKHWSQFFGNSRKKTTTWHGTVAGVLSSGCPQYFQSGTQELRESGWWRLTETKAPPLDVLSSGKSGSRKQRLENIRDQTSPLKLEGLRSRAGKTSIQAAMELRAKRDCLADPRDSKKAKLSVTPTPKSSATSPVRSFCSEHLSFESASTSFKDDSASRDDLQLPSSLECTPMRSNSSFDLASDLADQSSQMSFSSSKSEQWFTARDLVAGETVPECLLKDDEEESDLEIDPCALSPDMSMLASPSSDGKALDPLPQMEDILAALESKNKTKPESQSYLTSLQCNQSGLSTSFGRVKQEPISEENTQLTDVSSTVVKQEPMSEDSNTVDFFHQICRQSSGDSFIAPAAPSSSFVREVYDKVKCDETLVSLEGLKSQVKCEQDDAEEGKDVEEESKESDESPSSEEDSEEAKSQQEYAREKKRKRRTRDDTSKDEHKMNGVQYKERQRCIPMSLYDEKELLMALDTAVEQNEDAVSFDLRRLRRKLRIRQWKRQHGQNLFDVDNYMNNLYGYDTDIKLEQRTQILSPSKRFGNSDARILDRFQSSHEAYYQKQTVSFLTRLVGTEDDQLLSIKSPYTARVLKPFIRRDYESNPMKKKLLQEVCSYHHRNDPSWKPPPPASIDYCYVRPQHIPPVNTLCREFFWPGIDLSDCLQYPDFSCVALYRKFVIGFAFMVPDVKYNEAYISFIFTHPEWRRAGIGRFMVYHLIQTCMGKDVTLHVSASNPAMLLYQSFGFKTEELILDFYEKYFPPEAKDSRHAFFLRLGR